MCYFDWIIKVMEDDMVLWAVLDIVFDVLEMVLVGSWLLMGILEMVI